MADSQSFIRASRQFQIGNNFEDRNSKIKSSSENANQRAKNRKAIIPGKSL